MVSIFPVSENMLPFTRQGEGGEGYLDLSLHPQKNKMKERKKAIHQVGEVLTRAARGCVDKSVTSPF